MAKDRVFDATLVIDPREALLQQGYLWTVTELFDVPRDGDALITWEVGSGQLATIDLRVLSTQELIGDVVTITSISNEGLVLPALNRNFAFAPTASAPSTKFRLNPTVETSTGSGSPRILASANVDREFAAVIMPGGVHLGIRWQNQSQAFDAKVHAIAVWHEEPQHKFPAGDPGP
ncbi:MAG: hypothetical protein V3S55_03765 [Nitrospiraceae bacterium]